MKKGLSIVLVLLMLVLLLPTAVFALEQTLEPYLSIEYVVCDRQQKTAEGLFYWEYISIQSTNPDQRDAAYCYPKNTEIKLYNAAGQEVTGNNVYVTPVINQADEIEWFDLSLSAEPTQKTTYYLTVTEDGKGESVRASFEVWPYNATAVLRQRLVDSSYNGVLPAEAGESAEAAIAALAQKANQYTDGLGISVLTTGAEIFSFRPPKYGRPGSVTGTLALSNGDRVDCGTGIEAPAYPDPGKTAKYFELESGATAEFVFADTDAENSTKKVNLPVPFTQRIRDKDMGLSSMTSNRFMLSTDSNNFMASPTNITAGIYYSGLEQLELCMKKPTVSGVQTLYLWDTFGVQPDGKTGPMCIGSFTVKASIYSDKTTVPEFEETELKEYFPILLTLNNAGAYNASTVYRIYTKVNDTEGWVFQPDGMVWQAGRNFIAGHTTGPFRTAPYQLGITATQPGKAESEVASVTITEKFSGSGELSQALQEGDGTPGLVIAKGDVANASNSTNLTLLRIPADSKTYDELLTGASGATGGVVAAYELELHDAQISGNMKLKFLVGKELAGQKVLVAHKNSTTNSIETFVVTVDSEGYAEVTVNSLSPFMVRSGVTTNVPAGPGGGLVITTVEEDSADIPTTGDASLGLWLGGAALVACVAVVVIVLLRRRKG